TSYGIFNYMGGTIKVIDGGTITSNSSYGIANSGTIDLISDGTIIGTYAIYNTGMNSGRLNTITGGVFWGKSNVAITLAYDLNLEPNLSAQKGFGRYWGKDGVIFNNESRVKYPGSYFMSTRTEAVDGLSGVAFKYLTLSEATYEVTFVTAGGKFSDDTTSTIRYVAPPEIKVGMQNMPTIPTREGYYFYGWEDDDGYIFTGITEVRRNILVTALWQAVSYTIEYDANGGTGYMEDQLVSYDENVTLNTNTFIRQGYSFLGWNTEPDGSGTDYSDNQNFIWNQKDNLTLYAQWEANIYTVECMANGGIGSMLVQEATYGQDLTLDDNAYIKTGYTFIGWTTEQDGTGSEYVDGYSFTPWSLTENLVLYAQWQANTYTVSYLANGGVGEMSDDTTAYNNDFTLKANTFTRTGYTFKGWNTKADGSGDTYSDLHSFTPWDLDDSLELYAVWEANSYSVTYIANGGTGTMAADSVTYLANYAVRANAFTRSGYTFKNWNTQANGGGISYNAGGTIYIMGNLTLYAQWNEVVTPVEPTYSVSYLPGTHGTFAPLTISELTFGAATPASPIVTGQTGWIFTGWSPVRTATVTGNTTYTALWVQEPQTDDNFVVRFIDWNGNLLKSETVENGGAATAPSDPTRNGYEFTGWDREFDNITSDLTVTAQYKSIPQEVVGGTGEPTDETPEPPTNEDPDGNDESNHTTSEPEEYTQQEVLDIIKSEGIPTLTIGNLEIPLAAGSAMSKFVWALLNLILTLAGLIYAAVIIVRGAIEKRQDEYYDDEYQTEEDNQKPRRRLIPLFISVIMGIFGMILFLLTEDLTRLMVLVDRWTIVNALILVIEIVASSLAFRKQKEANDQEETDLHDMRAVGK
ncbi:MAG: InlB B-repeat-containing protein, partial [Oscillospiraceae bacterium]|nr:InlB B-repeat-containing protein [Oscillospiraceae bacterium]